jgi:hypothetical protein
MGNVHRFPRRRSAQEYQRGKQPPQRGPSWQWLLPVIAFLGAGAATYVASEGIPSLPASLDPACTIKGNISLTGERIYHVPGQEYYRETRIDPRYGERWFCSEDEARAAGWRKSRV